MKKTLCVMGFALTLLHCAASFGGITRYTQTCGNGDRFGVDMVKTSLSISRHNVTWHGKYDDHGKITWDSKNPPVPEGLILPVHAVVTTDGVAFTDGNVDDGSLCAVDR